MGLLRTKDKVKEHVGEVRSGLPVLLADIPKEERRRYTVSVSSVYRWIRDYERGNYDVRALIDALKGRSGRPGKSRLQGRVDEIIETKIEEVYLKERVRVTRKAGKAPSASDRTGPACCGLARVRCWICTTRAKASSPITGTNRKIPIVLPATWCGVLPAIKAATCGSVRERLSTSLISLRGR